VRADHRELLSVEEESEIRLFGGMNPVVVCHFRCANNISENTPIEPRGFRSFEQPILQNPLQLPGNIILQGCGKMKVLRRGITEQLKSVSDHRVNPQQLPDWHMRMRQPPRDSLSEETA
jgi:hypothetical protein